MTPSGIKPATFWFVAQHPNHCATTVPAGIMWNEIFREWTCTGHVESVDFVLCMECGGINSQKLSLQGVCVSVGWYEVKLNVDGPV